MGPQLVPVCLPKAPEAGATPPSLEPHHTAHPAPGQPPSHLLTWCLRIQRILPKEAALTTSGPLGGAALPIAFSGSPSQSCRPPCTPSFPQGPKSACPGEVGDPGCRSDAPGSPGFRPQEWGPLVPPWHRGPILGGAVQGRAALGFLSPSCCGSCRLGGGWQITACSAARALSRVRPTVCPAAGTVLRDPIPQGKSQREGRRLYPGGDQGPGMAAEDPPLPLTPIVFVQRAASEGWERLLLRAVVPSVVRGAGCGAAVRVVGRRPDGVPEARGQAAVTWSAASQDRDRWGGPWVDRWSLAAWGVAQGRCRRAFSWGIRVQVCGRIMEASSPGRVAGGSHADGNGRLEAVELAWGRVSCAGGKVGG